MNKLQKPNPSIDLVTFDLDNTLWDVMQTITAAEKLLRGWMAEHTPAALAIYASERVGDIREQVLKAHDDKRHDLSFLRIAVLRQCMLAADMSPADADENAKQAFAVFFAGRNDVAFYPNAVATLETAQRYSREFASRRRAATVCRHRQRRRDAVPAGDVVPPRRAKRTPFARTSLRRTRGRLRF